MEREPVTRFETKNAKLRATLLWLGICCAPLLLFCGIVVPRLNSHETHANMVMFFVVMLSLGAVALYYGVYKFRLSNVYSPKEIETWFNTIRLAKVLTSLYSILVYWRTVFGALMLAAWVLFILYDVFLK